MADCKARWEHHTGKKFDDTFAEKIDPNACHGCVFARVKCDGKQLCQRCKSKKVACVPYVSPAEGTKPTPLYKTSATRGFSKTRGMSSTGREATASTTPASEGRRIIRRRNAYAAPEDYGQSASFTGKRKQAPSTTPSGLSDIKEDIDEDDELDFATTTPVPAARNNPRSTRGRPRTLADVEGKCKPCRLRGVACNGKRPCNGCKDPSICVD